MCKYFMTDCAKVRATVWQRIAEHLKRRDDDENDPVVRWMNRAAVAIIVAVFIYGFGQQFGYFL